MSLKWRPAIMKKIYAPESLGFSRYKETDLDGGQTPEDAAKIFDQIMNNTATEAQKCSGSQFSFRHPCDLSGEDY